MKNKMGVAAAVIVLASTVAAGCASQAEDQAELDVEVSESVMTQESVPGGARLVTMTMVADVISIDYKKRKVTLQDAKGNKKTVTVDPEVANFDQVHKGDTVSLAYLEETIVYVKEPGETGAAEPAGAVVGATAAPGEKPADFLAGTVEVTAKVSAVDLENHTATLDFPDGTTQTVPVRPDVELNPDQVGTEVVFQITEAYALSVEKK